MKKIILAVSLFLVASMSLFADVVLKEKALEVANSFFKENATKSGETRRIEEVCCTLPELVSASPAKPFYIFNRENGGFVIVAGDDVMEPILAYSYTNSFPDKDVPDNIASLLKGFSSQISYMIRSGCPVRDDAWESVQTYSASTPVVQIETALWSQGDPFNRYYYPLIDGRKTITGCTNTAVGIIMRHYRYPEHGNGMLPDYEYELDGKTILQKGHALGHSYRWDAMPMKSDGYTDDEAEAVSRLLYDCSIMGQAMLGPDATATSCLTAVNGLIDYMGYDPRAIRRTRADVDDTHWVSIMKDELRDGRIILYAGYSDDSGHAFLLDGYDIRDFFSVNFGWGGYCNGFYRLDDLQDYNYNQEAYLNIQPNTFGEVEPFIDIKSCEYNGEVHRGLELENPDVTVMTGSPFKVLIGFICNGYSSQNVVYNGNLALGHIDRNGKIKQVFAIYDNVSLKGGWGYALDSRTITVKNKIEAGDRIVGLYTCKGEWRVIDYNRTSGVGSILLRDTDTIAETTSLEYDRESRTFSLATKKGVNIRFVNEAGKDVFPDFQRNEDGSYYLSAIRPGTYHLLLQKAEDEVDLTVKF